MLSKPNYPGNEVSRAFSPQPLLDPSQNFPPSSEREGNSLSPRTNKGDFQREASESKTGFGNDIQESSTTVFGFERCFFSEIEIQNEVQNETLLEESAQKLFGFEATKWSEVSDELSTAMGMCLSRQVQSLLDHVKPPVECLSFQKILKCVEEGPKIVDSLPFNQKDSLRTLKSPNDNILNELESLGPITMNLTETMIRNRELIGEIKESNEHEEDSSTTLKKGRRNGPFDSLVRSKRNSAISNRSISPGQLVFANRKVPKSAREISSGFTIIKAAAEENPFAGTSQNRIKVHKVLPNRTWKIEEEHEIQDVNNRRRSSSITTLNSSLKSTTSHILSILKLRKENLPLNRSKRLFPIEESKTRLTKPFSPKAMDESLFPMKTRISPSRLTSFSSYFAGAH